jgi:hypothetical protein
LLIVIKRVQLWQKGGMQQTDGVNTFYIKTLKLLTLRDAQLVIYLIQSGRRQCGNLKKNNKGKKIHGRQEVEK